MADYKFRCSDEELDAWRALAASVGTEMSAWVRNTLNAAISVGTSPQKPGDSVGTTPRGVTPHGGFVGTDARLVGTDTFPPLLGVAPRMVNTVHGGAALVVVDSSGLFWARLSCGPRRLEYRWNETNRLKAQAAVEHTWGGDAWSEIVSWCKELGRGAK